MTKRIILLILLSYMFIQTSKCESLNIDQKISILFELINQHKVSPDFYCYFYSKIFDVYFNLELMQSSQEVKSYFDSIINEYLLKSTHYCGSDECFHKIYDRLRMLKRLFHSEDVNFLIFCKQHITNRSLTQSFDEGRIMELYLSLVELYENR